MYTETTENFLVEVEPSYLPDQSKPDEGQFVFSYVVTIINQSGVPAQLKYRHWTITDGHGDTRKVDGPGVVGEEPEILPGQGFRYASFCPLTTPTGNMRGSYDMVDANGRTFSIRIPLFFLRDLRNLH